MRKIVTKDVEASGTEYVGRPGEAWFDESNQIRVGDGTTSGGTVASGGGSGGGFPEAATEGDFLYLSEGEWVPTDEEISFDGTTFSVLGLNFGVVSGEGGTVVSLTTSEAGIQIGDPAEEVEISILSLESISIQTDSTFYMDASEGVTITAGGGNTVRLGDTEFLGGTIIMENLPTSDPEIEGHLWNSDGTLMVSGGSAPS